MPIEFSTGGPGAILETMIEQRWGDALLRLHEENLALVVERRPDHLNSASAPRETRRRVKRADAAV